MSLNGSGFKKVEVPSDRDPPPQLEEEKAKLICIGLCFMVALWAKPQKPVLQGQKTKQS